MNTIAQDSRKARQAKPSTQVANSWIHWLEGAIAVTDDAQTRQELNRELVNWLDYSQKEWFL
jgi:hypothetical protein